MRLIKYGHSCVRFEKDGAVLVIDPGELTERAALDGVDAVLITHEHFDHLDINALADALGKRPSVTVYAHAEVLPKLDPVADVVTTVESGQSFQAAGLRVRAYGGRHAVIYPGPLPVANLGFLVEDSVYHPGDSFDIPTDAQVDTLFVPISAPWLKLSESVDFVRAVKPRRAFALHDSLLNDVGLRVVDAGVARLAGCDYTRLSAGEAVDA
jgi:L-ascorbate metabolism protein UlaG (beta-lactamase superfamily)